MSESNTAITSFDVFDTVIMRAVSRPTAVFFFLGRSIADKASPLEFSRLRIEAERNAEKQVPGGQPRLTEIYEELHQLTSWDRSDLTQLSHDEVRLEERLSYGIPQTLERIESARALGKPVIFISDMYLSAETVADLLKASGAWIKGDRLYVSGEHRASKREGTLFHKVLELEGLKASQLYHVGDNPIGDLRKPRKLGISAELIQPTKLNQYENILDRYCEETNGISALLSGTACLARLRFNLRGKHDQSLETVALSVAAPILTAFAKWIIDEASRQGIERLYFVARDGYVLKKFVDSLLTGQSTRLETRYLYGSRQAWRPVSVVADSEVDMSWAFESTELVSIEAVFERMGCAPSLAEDLLIEWGFAERPWSAPLSSEELKELKRCFEKSSEARSRVTQALQVQSEAALEYLDQEGLLRDSNWAMVDLGWHGSLQHSLSSLLSKRGGHCPMGLYFGLQSRGPNGPQDDKCKAFLFDHDRNKDQALPPSLIYLMESFCTAPHGTCVGYKKENGKYEPTFRIGHEKLLEDWGLETVHQAYQHYLSLLDVELLRPEDTSNLTTALFELLEAFSTRPGQNEAEAWGRFPYENDQNAAGITPLAQPKHANLRNLLYCINVGELPHAFIEWEGGSWSQTSPTSRRALSAARRLGRIKVRLSNFFRK